MAMRFFLCWVVVLFLFVFCVCVWSPPVVSVRDHCPKQTPSVCCCFAHFTSAFSANPRTLRNDSLITQYAPAGDQSRRWSALRPSHHHMVRYGSPGQARRSATTSGASSIIEARPINLAGTVHGRRRAPILCSDFRTNY